LMINSTDRIFTSQVLLLGQVNSINALYCQVYILIKAAFVPLIQVKYKISFGKFLIANIA